MTTRLGALLAGGAILLLAAAAAAQPEGAGKWARFQVWGVDSLALYGSFYPAQGDSAPVALMLHDRGGDSRNFVHLAAEFQAAGIPCLLPDLRGAGHSVQSRGGLVPRALRWGKSERELLATDLESVLRFADRQPPLAGRPWVILAEGEAAPLALELAAALPRVDRIVLMSPLLTEGEDTATLRSGLPCFLLACDEDAAAAAAVARLEAAFDPDLTRVDLPSCRARGGRMIRWVPGLSERLARWLGGTAGP